MAREYNLTNLDDGISYTIEVYGMDSVGNPSNHTDPLIFELPDITPPAPPMNLEVVPIGEEDRMIGGTWVELQWKNSTSDDCAGYRLYINNTKSGEEGVLDIEGRYTQRIRVEDLDHETEYLFRMRAYDDADVPNLSPPHPLEGGLSVKTLDITPPPAPELSIFLPGKTPYDPGSGYYNTTLIGLNVTVPGENRTVLQITLDGKDYVNPNPDIRWTTSDGKFEWIFSLDEGHHNITVRSIDPSLNAGPYSSIEFDIDLTRPGISIEGVEGSESVVNANESFTFSINTTDDNLVSSVHWTIEGEGKELEGETDEIAGVLEEGDYVCTVNVVDVAGNRNSTGFDLISRVPDNEYPTIIRSYPEDMEEVFVDAGADAGLAASIFHFGEYSIAETKQYLDERGIPVRL